MKLLSHRVGTQPSLHSIDDDTRQPVQIVKSVDISDTSPARSLQSVDEREAMILDFVQTRKGMMVIITDCSPGKEMGAVLSTVPRLMRNYKDHDVNENVRKWALRLGYTFEQFTGIVSCVEPPLDREKLIRDIRLSEDGDQMPMETVIERLKAMGVNTEDLLVEAR